MGCGFMGMGDGMGELRVHFTLEICCVLSAGIGGFLAEKSHDSFP